MYKMHKGSFLSDKAKIHRISPFDGTRLPHFSLPEGAFSAHCCHFQNRGFNNCDSGIGVTV